MTSQASKSWEYILQTLGKYILQIFGRQVLQILGLYILQNLGKCSCKYLKATFCKYLNRLCKRGYLQSRGRDACLAARCFDDSQAHDSTRRLITQSWRSRSSSSSRPRARRVPHSSVCILQLWILSCNTWEIDLPSNWGLYLALRIFVGHQSVAGQHFLDNS